MDVSEILDGLNTAQRQAVTSESRVLRVIAGAGSGKTKVLVQRMQWLMAVDNVSPWGLLALTFTNKAAREMRNRLEAALERPMTALWMGTFHGICLRILRRFAERMEWSKDFVIMDSDDQLRMIKRMFRARGWNDDLMKPKQMQGQINYYKEEGMRAKDVPASAHPMDVAVREFYGEYETACKRQGTMDFAELLLLTVELLRAHEDVKKHFQDRFQAILVDEFQDTNMLQFELVVELLSPTSKLFVVGDDDQAIYGWRGAKVENILQLDKVFPELETIRLEQNYRSTQKILDAANAVIAKNTQRLGKTLWSEGNSGDLVQIYPAVNEYDEARYVIECIEEWQHDGGDYHDCAILYRSNAQSRVFEELLLQKRIPYRVYGGLRFFERAEVKDALAYLRLTRQPEDDGALDRVLNQPPRGIGAKTQSDVRELARRQNKPMWEIINDAALVKAHFNGRASNALAAFASLVHQLHEKVIATASLANALRAAVHDSGLYHYWELQTKEDAETKRENLDELINAGAQRDTTAPLNADKVLDFLADAALDAGDGQAEEGSDSVQLMTLHTAKGLEFPNVFIVGMEEDLFPSSRSVMEVGRLEEERRLAYVGMTRAMQHLTLSFAERRRWQGQDTYPQPSRFLYEIPQELTQPVRPMVYQGITTARLENTPDDAPKPATSGMEWRPGDVVTHPKFGEGCIITLEGNGAHQRALIHFEQVGDKWLVLAFAKLSHV